MVLGYGTQANRPLILGFISIVVSLCIWDFWLYEPASGQCQISFRLPVILALLIFDVLVNLWLTWVFVHYLRPYLTKGVLKAFVPKGIGDLTISRVFKHATPNTDFNISIAIPQADLIRVIRNTLIGCIAMCAATIANCLVLIILQSHEEVWMLFTFRTLDEPDSEDTLVRNDRLALTANAREMAQYANVFSSPENIMEIFDVEHSTLNGPSESRRTLSRSRKSTVVTGARDEISLMDAVLEDMFTSSRKR
ncbi:hypothetical protein BP6252_05221 [Coleophoma cylindrospora]|uniref:Uncharacterized protein n=1 Tax=Coleophoma cylindrospora TaxID=1849047 RepID=A0A3D8RT75_9HELO|nr:hypothetical protein BP6252_05221 [Coleophoma cylindrospora]